LVTVNEVLADALVPVNTYIKLRFAVDAIRLRKLADPDGESAERESYSGGGSGLELGDFPERNETEALIERSKAAANEA
jgi:hypothetical protein